MSEPTIDLERIRQGAEHMQWYLYTEELATCLLALVDVAEAAHEFELEARAV